MDKKKLFQKQLLQSKLDENSNILLKLQILYDDLKLKSIENSATTETTNETTNDISNTNIIYENKITKLLETKKFLIDRQKTIKLNLNNLTFNISKLEEDLKYLPEIFKEQYNKELNIYNEELIRIDNYNVEIINTNIDNLNTADLDKEKLLTEIKLLQNNIDIQSNTISTIQITCHSSRKKILENLQEKKQMKLKLNTNIDNCNLSINIITDKINELNKTVENIIDFKKILVDSEYNIEHNIIKLNKYYEEFNIDNTISINDKIIIIEDILNNYQNQIILFTKKLNKTDLINNINIKDNINTYNKTNKTKVITYKDNFKIEKEKKKELEVLLEYKLNKYNNYQQLIIDKINEDFNIILETLKLDKKKALDRFSITQIRINKDFEKTKKLLKSKIENTKLEINTYNEEIYNINKNINLLNIKIDAEKKIDNEIIILENKIYKHKEIIIQTEKDLLTLQ